MSKRTEWGIFSVLLLMAVLILGQRAQAVSNYLPDASEMSSGPNVHLEIAQSGTLGEINLDAPETWVKIYFNAGGSIGVLLADGKFDCDPSLTGLYDYLDTQGLARNCTDPAAVNYTVYCSDASGNNPDFTGWNYAINSNDPKINASAGPGYHGIFSSPTIPSPCPNIGGRYVVYVLAEWANASPPEGRINGFKAATNVGGALVSYWAGSGNYYAVQNRIDQMPGEDAYMNFVFAPPCDLSPDPQLASLIWQDADAAGNGGSPADGGFGFAGDKEPAFDLFEGDPVTGVWQKMAYVSSSGTFVEAGFSFGITPANVGGNNDVRQLQFTAKRDKLYSWKWYDVNWDNGIQMQLPFDSYFAAKTGCPPPIGPDHGVQGRVFNDLNGNGVFDAGEQIVKTPGSPCDAPQTIASVSITADGATGGLDVCNGVPPDALFPGPGSYALYKIRTSASGPVNVRLNLPPGWVATNGTDRTLNVPAGPGYVSATLSEYFGIRQIQQGVQGRVFIDDNNDGFFNPATDKIVKNPASACTGPNIYVPGVTVTATTAPGPPTSNLDVCNGPFPPELPGPPGTTYSLYQVATPSGLQTVRVNVPPDWIVNTRLGNTRTYNVPVNGWGGPTTLDEYFAILPRQPDVTPICVNSNSLARITWPAAGLGVTGYYVDISTSSNFSTFSNKFVGSSAPRDIGNAPAGFSGSINTKFIEGSTYYARIFYQGPNVHSAVRQFTAKGCPKLECGNLTTTPTDPEEGDPFDMVASFRNIGQGDLAASANLHVIFPGYYNNTNTSYTPRPLSPSGTGTALSVPINLTVPAGSYTVTWTVTGDPQSNQLIDPNVPGTCSRVVRVFKKPYFRAFGGDVIAGGSATCSKWTPTAGTAGSILAFSKSDGSPALRGKGAGTQLLAQALSTISGFSSAQHRTASPLPDKGLTLANTGVSQFGGAFGLGDCPPDYFGDRSPGAAPGVPLLLAPGAQASGAYWTGGAIAVTLSFPANSTVGDGKSLVQYVDGDAYITGNIVYQSTTWGSVNDIPSYTLIASGNIYISSNVTRLDGIYIAQPRPDGTKGTIYTCSVAPPAVPSDVQIATQCSSRLTINGAALARTIKLYRSDGTTRTANANDCPVSMPGIFSCAGSSTAAEQFIYTPEVWIRRNFIRQPQRPATYDVISSLPPIL